MHDAVPPPTPPALRPAGPVVPAAELGLWTEARAALARAASHVEETRAWGRRWAEAERTRGFAEGHRAGQEAAAELVAATLRHATLHLAALEREVPDLVYAIVADILGQFEDADLIGRSLRHALATLQPAADAVLRVAPGEVGTARAALADLGQPIRIEADPAMAAGECSLESALGRVELGLAAQMRILREHLSAAPSAGATAIGAGAGDNP